MVAADPEALVSGRKIEPRKMDFGVLQPNSTVIFEKAPTSILILTGKAKVPVIYSFENITLSIPVKTIVYVTKIRW